MKTPLTQPFPFSPAQVILTRHLLPVKTRPSFAPPFLAHLIEAYVNTHILGRAIGDILFQGTVEVRQRVITELESYSREIHNACMCGEALEISESAAQTVLVVILHLCEAKSFLWSPPQVASMFVTLSYLSTVLARGPYKRLMDGCVDAFTLKVISDESYLSYIRHTLPTFMELVSGIDNASQVVACDAGVLFHIGAIDRLVLNPHLKVDYPKLLDGIAFLFHAIKWEQSARVREAAHACLCKVVANPRLLAYRAGRDSHWDEARRRFTIAYLQVRGKEARACC